MSELITQKYRHILSITLNRPDIHNAISHQTMIDELTSTLDLADNDPDIRVVTLTGSGKSFCAGGNIKDMKTKSDMFGGTPKEVENAYKSGIQKIPLAIQSLKKPIIAAVNGAAIGAGCDLAMMCDIRIGSEHAKFAESFVKLGIIPGDGGAWFLPRIIGNARAAEMALTGKIIDAKQALEWGMISQVVPSQDLDEQTIALAESIADLPPLAVQNTKQLLKASAQMSLDEMLETCAKVQSQLHQTDDHMEAVNAFLDKRKGIFNGS